MPISLWGVKRQRPSIDDTSRSPRAPLKAGRVALVVQGTAVRVSGSHLFMDYNKK